MSSQRRALPLGAGSLNKAIRQPRYQSYSTSSSSVASARSGLERSAALSPARPPQRRPRASYQRLLGLRAQRFCSSAAFAAGLAASSQPVWRQPFAAGLAAAFFAAGLAAALRSRLAASSQPVGGSLRSHWRVSQLAWRSLLRPVWRQPLRSRLGGAFFAVGLAAAFAAGLAAAFAAGLAAAFFAAGLAAAFFAAGLAAAFFAAGLAGFSQPVWRQPSSQPVWRQPLRGLAAAFFAAGLAAAFFAAGLAAFPQPAWQQPSSQSMRRRSLPGLAFFAAGSAAAFLQPVCGL